MAAARRDPRPRPAEQGQRAVLRPGAGRRPRAHPAAPAPPRARTRGWVASSPLVAVRAPPPLAGSERLAHPGVRPQRHQYKIADFTPLEFLRAQIDEIHPVGRPASGSWASPSCSCAARGRRFRVLGIVYAVALVVMVVQKSKPYYLGPAYPMLLAAGAVAVEQAAPRGSWLRSEVLRCSSPRVGHGGAPCGVHSCPWTASSPTSARWACAPPPPRSRPGPPPPVLRGPLRLGGDDTDGGLGLRGPSPARADQRAHPASNYGEAGALRYHGRAPACPRR